MKKLNIYLVAAIVLVTSSFIVSQENTKEDAKQITAKENVGKITNDSQNITAPKLVRSNPFLYGKRHGAYIAANNNVQNITLNKKSAKRKNFFLAEKRHQ